MPNPTNYSIKPIPAFQDNYIWLIEHQQQAICIDPGQAEPVLTVLQQHQLTLNQIWITHAHHDHTGGITKLKQHYPQCHLYGASDIKDTNETLQDNSQITWQNITITTWQTAGHTEHHLCYLANINQRLHIFCGDTLFSAGCGRAFTNRPDWLYQSFQKLNTLPEHSLLYPAHEYTLSNLRFALSIEPNNPHIQAALKHAEHTQSPTLPTTLAHERLVNPFLRCHQPSVIQAVTQKTACSATPEAVFIALRQLKDNF